MMNKEDNKEKKLYVFFFVCQGNTATKSAKIFCMILYDTSATVTKTTLKLSFVEKIQCFIWWVFFWAIFLLFCFERKINFAARNH